MSVGKAALYTAVHSKLAFEESIIKSGIHVFATLHLLSMALHK